MSSIQFLGRPYTMVWVANFGGWADLQSCLPGNLTGLVKLPHGLVKYQEVAPDEVWDVEPWSFLVEMWVWGVLYERVS